MRKPSSMLAATGGFSAALVVISAIIWAILRETGLSSGWRDGVDIAVAGFIGNWALLYGNARSGSITLDSTDEKHWYTGQ